MFHTSNKAFDTQKALQDEVGDNSHRKNESFHNFRYIMLLCSGIAVGLMYTMRLAVTVAIINMVNQTQIYLDGHHNASDQQMKEFFTDDYIEVGEFNWNHEIQEKIITIYMITYTLFPIMTTHAILKFGFRKSIIACLLACALPSILTPTMSYWGWEWIVLLRLVMGAASSGLIPGLVSLVEQWTTPSESATGIVIFQFLGHFITVLTPLLTGHLVQYSWKLAFYLPGIVTLVFCLVWWFIVPDSPEQSRLISQKELSHIKENLQVSKQSEQSKCNNSQNKLNWLFMFKVREFYYLTIIWSLYCASAGFGTYLMPAYLHHALRVPAEGVGASTFFVQIASLFSMLWPNYVVNFLMVHFEISLTAARRIVVFICSLMAITTLLYVAYSHQFVIVLISIHKFFQMTLDTIFLLTVISNFSPSKTSGPVYSVINSLSCINVLLFCVAAGKFLDYYGETTENWSWVLAAVAAMSLLFLVIYSIFCHSRAIDIKHAPSDDAVKA